jgi:hypothetical protein
MKWLLPQLFLATGLLAGCVSLADVDTSKKDPICVRQCSISVSQCMGNGGYVRGCKDAFRICIESCPDK